MSTSNILGAIGEKVGQELKALRVSLSGQISSINLNNITGGLDVTQNAQGIGISTNGKIVGDSVSVAGSLTALGQISALRASTSDNLSVGTTLGVTGHTNLSTVSLSGSLSAQNAEFLGSLKAASLEVSGDTKIINTTTVEVSDNILELNKSSDSSTTATVSGIEINRGLTAAVVATSPVGNFGVGHEGNGLIGSILYVQAEESVNGNPVYENGTIGATALGISEGQFRIVYQEDMQLSANYPSAYGLVAGETYSGWKLEQLVNGTYSDFLANQDPYILASVDQSGADVVQKMETWLSALRVSADGKSGSLNETDLFSNGGSGTHDIKAHRPDSFPSSDGRVNLSVPYNSTGAITLVTQAAPMSGSVSTSNDKAKILWDNAADQQKFKLMVGDEMGDLSLDDLSADEVSATKVAVPNGGGLTINNVSIGTFADFSSELTTAKS